MRLLRLKIILILLFILTASDSVFASCEILNYSVYQESYVSDPYAYGTARIITQTCIDLTIKNLSSVGHSVKDFKITATLDDGSSVEMPLIASDPNKIIGAGEKFDSKACWQDKVKFSNIGCKN